MELHAVKGVAKDHAKFSPVGTFWGSSDHFIFNLYLFFFFSYCVISPTTAHQNHETHPFTFG